MASTNGTSGNGQRQYTQPQQATITNDRQLQAMLLQRAQTEVQSVYSNTLYPPTQPDVNITPQAVGIMTRLWLICDCVFTNTSGTEIATLTEAGISALLSRVRFYDTNNLLRVDTDSQHLTLVSAAKRFHPYAGNADYNQVNGNNVSGLFNVKPASWGILQAPATIAAGATATIRAVFEVPIAASVTDLRGALFVQTVNSTMNLYVEFNKAAFVDTGTNPALDDTFSVYKGAPGTFTSCQLTVYQEFLDQLPRDVKSGAYILPNQALSIAYMLNKSTTGGVVQAQDYPVPYINFRSYLSRFLIYNNSGQTGGRAFGTDVNYIEEIAANFAPYFKYDALFAALKAREVYQNDLPAGYYYINHRHKPVYTTQNGNRQTIINPSTAGNGAYVCCYSEFFANQNVLQGAGSAA